MYDDLFEQNTSEYEWQKITDKEEIRQIITKYMESYFDITSKDEWFNGIKKLTEDLGYCANMKEYKQNPSQYKGNVADISTVLRVALTKKSMTPDLYEIMRLIGKDRIVGRFNRI